jgi:hypothetical protein
MVMAFAKLIRSRAQSQDSLDWRAASARVTRRGRDSGTALQKQEIRKPENQN